MNDYEIPKFKLICEFKNIWKNSINTLSLFLEEIKNHNCGEKLEEDNLLNHLIEIISKFQKENRFEKEGEIDNKKLEMNSLKFSIKEFSDFMKIDKGNKNFCIFTDVFYSFVESTINLPKFYSGKNDTNKKNTLPLFSLLNKNKIENLNIDS